MYYGSNRSSYGKSLSYNYSSDLSLSSLTPRIPSIQRVINSDYGSRDRSISPSSRDYSPSRGLSSALPGNSSPTFRRRDFGDTEKSSPGNFLNDIDYSIKPRNFYDYSSKSSLFSYSSAIKKPKRTDYTDYLRPVLTTRPTLKSGYAPRSRNERENVETPLVRERKLIKFREVSDEVLEKIRRRISWDLPEEISSPLIDEMKQKYEVPADDSSTPEQSSSRRGSKESVVSPISGSPRHSVSRRSSADQTHDRPIRPPIRKNSRSNSLITSSIECIPEDFQPIQDHSIIPIPPPRKKSLSSSTKGKKSRKSSLDILLSEEKTQNYSKIAEDIRRNREIAERIRKLAEESVDEDKQPSHKEETESPTENKSSSISKETVAVPDRSRRRRRVSIPEPDIIEEPPPEVRKRVRSRYKSRESSQSISPSAELKPKDTCEDETPRIASRMHRKSVKYKTDSFPPRRSSKCTETFPDSTMPLLQEISSVDKSKSNILVSQDKRYSSFISDKKDDVKKVSKPLPIQKEISENKIKQEENRMKINSNETVAKSKLVDKLPSSKNKENEKQVGKIAEASKEKSKINEKASEKTFKIDKADQSTSNIILNANINKSKNFEDKSKAVTKHFSDKIIDSEEKQFSAESSNKAIKNDLKVSSGEDSSEIKISSKENKNIDRKIPLEEKFSKNLKTSLENKSDDLPKKGAPEICSKTKDKTTKLNYKTSENKSLNAEEIKSEKNCKKSDEKHPNNNALIKDTNSASKDYFEEKSKSIIQKKQTENCADSKSQSTIPHLNEVEEVVVVCKLPKKNEFELKNIPSEQKVVVSIKNSELKSVENKKISTINTADKIIPTGADQFSKLQNCDIKKNVDSSRTEPSDINVTHTIVLKPKSSDANIPTKSKAGKDVQLKSIPDVIKNTVNCNSKETDISDVVKSTLSKLDDKNETKKSVLSGKDKLAEKSRNNIANDMKYEKLAPVSENFSKDNSQLKQIIQETSTLKVDTMNKDLPAVKKSSSAVFETTKEISNSSNIKKSSSEVLDESKETKKSLAKPDLLQMTTNDIKKAEDLSNLTKLSINKKLDEKSSLNYENNSSLIAGDSGKHRVEQLKESSTIESTQSKITSDIAKKEPFQSDSSKQQLQCKITDESKSEENNDIKKSKTESSIAKTVQKHPVSVRGKSESEDIKPNVQIIVAKTSDNKIKTNILQISPTEGTENKELPKFHKENITKKDENKNVILQIPGIKNLKESTDYAKSSEMKNTTSSDHKNVKQTTHTYKKSMTLPNVNAVLEECNNCTEKRITGSSDTAKKDFELGTLSVDNELTILREENSVESLKAIKSQKTDIMKSNKSDNQTNSSQLDKKSVGTFQLPKINSGNIKQNLIETSKTVEVSESDKKCDSEKLMKDNVNQNQTKPLNQCDENKNEFKLLPKLKVVDNSKIEKSESVPKLDGTKDLSLIKIEADTENKDKLVKKDKEIISDKHDANKNTQMGIGNIQRTEMDRKILPPEVLKLPAIQNAAKQSTDIKQKGTLLPQIQKAKSDETAVSDSDNLIKNESQMSNFVANENLKNNIPALESKQLDLNSNKIDSTEKNDVDSKLDKLSEISEKENTTNLKVKTVTEQQTHKATNVSAPPKPNKIKQPKMPQYKRYGLFIKPKESPKTILESSSSSAEETTESESETETESESSSDEETSVINKTITNGKYPERSSNDYTPKKRSHSETSNTSISSTSSISTICTTIQEPWDNSPQKINQTLKFRKYGVDDFIFLKLLGKGSFGKVLLAELKDCSMYFAIKCLKKDVVLEDDDVESTMIERRVLALGTQHPYMCKLYCTFQTKGYLYFVMEYLNGGDLMFHIQENGRFEEKRAVFYGAEIVSALKFLHKRGIVYRDIKLDNLMLDQQGHIRLVDFGMCQCRIYKEECMPSNFCGTPTYIAPEIVLGQKYNQSVDWWSFGVLLYEMLIGRSPFQGTDEDELFWSICNEEPHYPRFLSKEATHILGLLLVKAPSKRLGMPSSPAGDIKDHAFFKNIDWSKIENKEIAPVFKPSVSGPCDTSNFDSSFTMDSATLSPVDSDVLKSMDQEQFNGFSYTNPHLTG